MRRAPSKSDLRARARRFEGPGPAEKPLPSTEAVASQWIVGVRREARPIVTGWFEAIRSTGISDPAAVVEDVIALIQREGALARRDKPQKRQLCAEALLQITANPQGAEAFARHLLATEEAP